VPANDRRLGRSNRHAHARGQVDAVIGVDTHRDRHAAALLDPMASFGTLLDVTMAELAIESFFPADPGTGSALRDL
jgi:hypothetical protein